MLATNGSGTRWLRNHRGDKFRNQSWELLVDLLQLFTVDSGAIRTFRTFQLGPHQPAKKNRGGALWRNLRAAQNLLPA
jgi:hypothetical protein